MTNFSEIQKLTLFRLKKNLEKILAVDKAFVFGGKVYKLYEEMKMWTCLPIAFAERKTHYYAVILMKDIHEAIKARHHSEICWMIF